jgi:hypothetical protein
VLEEPTDAELLAMHFGPGTAYAAARSWARLVIGDGNLRDAWPLTDPDWRRFWADTWVSLNEDHRLLSLTNREELAVDLATAEPTSPFAGYFFAFEGVDTQEGFAYVDLATWVWVVDPPAAPGYETVRLMNPDSPGQLAEDLVFVMHHVDGDGWLVARTMLRLDP